MVNMEITQTFRKQELEFEARYYLSEAKRLQRQGMSLIHEADDMIEHAVNTWNRAKEVGG
jgi:hypothetical protein